MTTFSFPVLEIEALFFFTIEVHPFFKHNLWFRSYGEVKWLIASEWISSCGWVSAWMVSYINLVYNMRKELWRDIHICFSWLLTNDPGGKTFFFFKYLVFVVAVFSYIKFWASPKKMVSPCFWCDKSVCGFLGLPSCVSRVGPEIYGTCGLFELLGSNVVL